MPAILSRPIRKKKKNMKKIKVIYKKLEFQYKSVLILAIKLIFMGFFVLCLHTHTQTGVSCSEGREEEKEE